MRLGPAQLVVDTVCVHNHLSTFEQPQTVTTTPMSSHELDTHSMDTSTVAEHRMSYHEYVPGAYYGLKYRAPQKRYLVNVLGLRLLCRIGSAHCSGRMSARRDVLGVGIATSNAFRVWS
jgi:hypothetical protein